jgi:transcriptional regulator with PAS, ATPase and Fis domain
MPDVRRFVDATVERKGNVVIGPTTRLAWAEIERAARFGEVLLLSGESGAGKELAARAFHALGPRAGGPFIGVNCAAIPEGLAERLLFGARRGAYSGANADSDGYLQAADGGTLFLDEVADLDAPVQAKLLRALETKEVLPLGASKPRAVDVRVCSATRDLRGEVAKGRFREDLYFRIGQPEVRIPALRERRDEIPWLLASELGDLSVSFSFVEACLRRPWPGNVRELLSEARRVAGRARSAGRTTVSAEDLSATAGLSFAQEDASGSVTPPAPDAATIERVLQENKGNVTRTAQALGMHRNQLRRWLVRRGSAAAPEASAHGSEAVDSSDDGERDGD